MTLLQVQVSHTLLGLKNFAPAIFKDESFAMKRINAHNNFPPGYKALKQPSGRIFAPISYRQSVSALILRHRIAYLSSN